MSRRNVEIARAALFPERMDLVAVLNSGEVEDIVDLSVLAPDLHVEFATPGGPPTEYHGVDGLIEGWREWLVPWARYEIVVEEYIEAGNRVVALALLRGETRRDHVEIEQQAAAVITFREGKIRTLEFHLDRRDALRVAGLE